MEVQGKIKLVGNVQEITDSFRKRELVIVTQEQYPQTLCVEFVQDKTDLLNDFQEGQEVKIGINLRGCFYWWLCSRISSGRKSRTNASV